MNSFGWPEFFFILRSAGWTLLLTAVAFLIGGALGAALAIMRLSANRVLSGFASGYILTIQSIPVLMVLFMSYYGLSLFGIRLPAFFCRFALALDLCLGLSRGDLARLD
jgi:polar amino acid transport system permease protein